MINLRVKKFRLDTKRLRVFEIVWFKILFNRGVLYIMVDLIFWVFDREIIIKIFYYFVFFNVFFILGMFSFRVISS